MRKLTIRWETHHYVLFFDARYLDVPSAIERKVLGREIRPEGLTDSEALHQALCNVDPGATYTVTFEEE